MDLTSIVSFRNIDKNPQNLFDCFAMPFTLWIQPWDNHGLVRPLNKTGSTRAVVVLWLMVGLIFLEGYNGSLRAALLAQEYEKQPDTLKGSRDCPSMSEPKKITMTLIHRFV